MALASSAKAGLHAVVLAGGPRDDVCEHDADAPNKAFVTVGGATLVARTIAALRATPGIGRIVAVAPADPAHGGRVASALADADDVRASGGTMLESLRAGLAGFDPDVPLIVSASDLPVLSRLALEDFISRAAIRDADLVYACVERRVHEARFPHVPHTWAHLRNGTFCGGGCVLMRPRVLPALGNVLGRLGAARKNPFSLAAIFGPAVLLRYATRSLSLPAIERRASRLLRCDAAAAVCAYPEIAVNVDRQSDVALAERLISSG